MAVFLVIGCLFSGAWFIGKTGFIEEKAIPAGASFLAPSAEGAEVAVPAALGAASEEAPGSENSTLGSQQEVVPLTSNASPEDATVSDPGQAIGPAFANAGVVSYTVRKGDNISTIASNFGISVATIVAANPGVKTSRLKAGQALLILPTSGVVYQAMSGDNLASIAQQFGISQEIIQQFNHSVNFSSLDPGTPIIIPGGTNTALLATNDVALPNFNNQFIMPANGYNAGNLSSYNAVDITNFCGTPVVAAADGVVISDSENTDTTDGWNGGYGNFVLIQHSFGNDVRTRYAYLEKVNVQPGDYVTQGQVIGLMGQTGQASSCRVHFEVYGARNPFVKS